MSLETEHRGYKIRYSENGDEWTCYDAGNGMTAPTLSKMKEKIDRMALAERKASSFRCLEFSGYSSVDTEDASIIEYLGPTVEGGGWTGKPHYISKHKVASVANRKGKERPTRRESDLSNFLPDTPEVRAALEDLARLHKVAEEARKAFDAARKAIPRVTVADIAPLVKLSGIDPTGGLKDG